MFFYFTTESVPMLRDYLIWSALFLRLVDCCQPQCLLYDYSRVLQKCEHGSGGAYKCSSQLLFTLTKVQIHKTDKVLFLGV